MNWSLVGTRGRITDPESVLRAAQAWAAGHGAEVLVADARAVFGRVHVESAVLHAVRARTQQRMMTRSIAMETLVYLSGKRQVAEAIRVAGIREGTTEAVVLGFEVDSLEPLLERLRWTRDDSVLEPGRKSVAILGVRAEEERTLPPKRRAALALERVALVDVLK